MTSSVVPKPAFYEKIPHGWQIAQDIQNFQSYTHPHDAIEILESLPRLQDDFLKKAGGIIEDNAIQSKQHGKEQGMPAIIGFNIAVTPTEEGTQSPRYRAEMSAQIVTLTPKRGSNTVYDNSWALQLQIP